MSIELLKQIILHSIGAFGGTLGYAFLLNAPLCTVLPASLTGLLGYVLYEVMMNLLGQGAPRARIHVLLHNARHRRAQWPGLFFLWTGSRADCCGHRRGRCRHLHAVPRHGRAPHSPLILACGFSGG